MKPYVGIQLSASFALIVGVVCSSLSATDSAPAIPLPEIPERIFDVTKFGAVTNGQTLNTGAIQKTIDAAEQAGGGTVLIPAGQFISGPVKLQSNIRLYLAKRRAACDE
jgi:polygalacturonase